MQVLLNLPLDEKVKFPCVSYIRKINDKMCKEGPCFCKFMEPWPFVSILTHFFLSPIIFAQYATLPQFPHYPVYMIVCTVAAKKTVTFLFHSTPSRQRRIIHSSHSISVLWSRLDWDRSLLSTIDWPRGANRLCSPPNAIAWIEQCFFWLS